MKIGFLFLSILAMATTCWWTVYYRRDPRTRLGWHEKRRIAVHSVLAGIVVYFLLLMFAALYMLLRS